MINVKICGITNEEDALLAAELGAGAVGFVFAESPRRVTPEQAAAIGGKLPPFVFKTGVFVNASMEETARVMKIAGLDLIQLHGEEGPIWGDVFPRRIIRAFSGDIPPGWDGKARAYLLDAAVRSRRGGTGVCADWELGAHYARRYPLILAGGLTPENVGEAVRKVRPLMVDVSSGVEKAPGKKDPAKLKAFFAAIREA
ncbi:MAG: phosphoribosylanthranilate isomerase [Bacillota bacterium]